MHLNKIDIGAEGFYAGVQIVSKYLTDRWSLIETIFPRPELGHRDSSIQGLYLRALAWVQTLEKLNDPIGVQAILAAKRGLLEVLVDLIFLHYDKTNEKGWRMYWWAKSERLKAAEETMEFYQNRGLPIPDRYNERKQSWLRDKSEIDDMRKRLWPNKNPNKASHPKRWTGSGGLLEDIRNADDLHGQIIKGDLGVTLEELYCTEFRHMSWFVHSGLASILNLPPEAFLLACGLAFHQSADLGMSIAKIVLKDFGLTEHLPGLGDEWEQVKKQRVKGFIEVMNRRTES